MADELTSELAKQALEPVKDVTKRIFGPLADEVGLTLAALAQPYRTRRQVEALLKTQRMLREAGIAAKAVRPRLLLPILDGASVEDDEGLHERWAALLANAATSEELVHPSHIEILKLLGPGDAQLLDKLYDFSLSKRNRTVTPWVVPISLAERERRLKAGENPEAPFEHLVRLGLIEAIYTFDGSKIKVSLGRGRPEVSGDLEVDHLLTDSADGFVKACRPPKSIDAEQLA